MLNENKGKQLLGADGSYDHGYDERRVGSGYYRKDISGNEAADIQGSLTNRLFIWKRRKCILRKLRENTITEKFMLFFWPREKVTYTITAKIVVRIKYLDYTEEVG